MDKIEINGLEVYAHHGVYEEEQKLGQKFVVTARLYLDTSEAGNSDELEKTVNYGAAAKHITAVLQKENYKLLEKAASVTAQEILLANPLVEKVDIRIEKPWAPIGLPVNTAAVEITRKWHSVYIALGSNLGEKKNYLEEAVKQLQGIQGIIVDNISDWITTKPYGYTDQPDFLNGCIHLKTWFSPEQLLNIMQEIEKNAGRERKIHWGPRTLDLDILFYDDEIIGTRRLVIPHPEIEKRSFVLEPMAQIAPWYRHPVSKKTMSMLLEQLRQQG